MAPRKNKLMKIPFSPSKILSMNPTTPEESITNIRGKSWKPSMMPLIYSNSKIKMKLKHCSSHDFHYHSSLYFEFLHGSHEHAWAQAKHLLISKIIL
jgi:hypothetical protein